MTLAVALMPFAVLLAYLAVQGSPAHAPAPPVRGHVRNDLDRMLADLHDRLARSPMDVDGWVLLGRTLAASSRWDEAAKAFAQAVALRPKEAALHMQLGEAVVLAAGGRVGAAAAAEFAKAPDDPRARYYSAVAQAQAGDTGAAKAGLHALAADAPADAPWLSLVRGTLRTLEDAPDAAAPLENLRRRVAMDPEDAESWLALARAYDETGDLAQARDTLARATAAVPFNLDLLLAYGAHLSDETSAARLPPAFIAVMHRVEAIDPDQPDALWYLGLEAAAGGDTAAAARRWRRLLAQLPQGDESAAVKKRLRLLPPSR